MDSSGKSVSSRPWGGLDPEDVDLSPSETVLALRSLLPPLRVPVAAGEADSPDQGPFLLAFADQAQWRAAWAACDRRLQKQCELGAQVGCSLASTSLCRPSWWDKLLARSKEAREELAARREVCEQAQMLACRADAAERCSTSAKEQCGKAFSQVDIAQDLEHVHPRFLDAKTRQVLARQKELRGSGGSPREASGPDAALAASDESPFQQCVLNSESDSAPDSVDLTPDKSPGRWLSSRIAKQNAAELLVQVSGKQGDMARRCEQQEAQAGQQEDSGAAPLVLSNVLSAQDLLAAAGFGGQLGQPSSNPGKVSDSWGDTGENLGTQASGWEGGLIKPRLGGTYINVVPREKQRPKKD